MQLHCVTHLWTGSSFPKTYGQEHTQSESKELQNKGNAYYYEFTLLLMWTKFQTKPFCWITSSERSESYANIKMILNTFYVSFLPWSTFSCIVIILEMDTVPLSLRIWKTSRVNFLYLPLCKGAEIVEDFSVNESCFWFEK